MNPSSLDEEKQLGGSEPRQQARKQTNDSKKSKESNSSTTGSKQPQLAVILAVFASVWGLMKRIFSQHRSLGRKKSTTDQTNQPMSMDVEKGPAGSPPMPYHLPTSLTPNMRNIDISQSAPSRFLPDYPVVPTAVIAEETDAQIAYAAHKKRLLAGEDSGSWMTPAQEGASETELLAQKTVWKLREFERDVTFGNVASEAIPGPETLDMGGQFLTNRDRIVNQSKIYKIAEQVPKGAHLHLHFNAELAPDSLIDQAKNNPYMHIRTTQPLLTDEDYDNAEVVFNVLPKSTPSVDVWSASYNPDFRTPGSTPWMLWSTFRTEFEKRRGIAAEIWVRTKLILTEEETYGTCQTTNGIWARFNQATRCFKGLLNYESIYRWYCRAAIDSMVKDKVMYAELRPMLMDKFIPSDDGERKLDHAYQMRMIIEAVQDKQTELKSKGEFEKFPFGVKIIYCAPRSIPKSMMRREIADCIALKKEFPDLICGFDLVGAEDRRNHIGFYAEELLDMVKTCKEQNLDIPFMFHAGESLLDTGGSKDPANSNLYDAVLLNAKRVGHGFSLLKHPFLVEEFKRRKICVELCPTSNELLHLCRNIKEHPYPEILAAGIPCTINSDNPSLFR
jgi:adenosine deaminase CECR1